jgi:AbrB family looped-hinge helix DNA binding protein
MSSKGQVVIPEDIRNQLGLSPGTRFVVVGEGDAIILKVLATPSMSEFDGLIQKARLQAKKTGMTRSDIKKAVKATRKKT